MAKQTIALVGAEGKTGSALALGLVRLNLYRLLLLSEDESRLQKLSQQILLLSPEADIELISCIKDGCWEADVVIVDVPHAFIRDVADKIKEVSTQKIVFAIPAAQEWEQLLPNAKVVTGILNNPDMPEVAMAGNDRESVLIMADLIKKLGFQPVIKESFFALNTL
ncbi:MAG: NAD(P)-binding domain-containing protein [Bacteroidota bacterium]|nr:NAD(P)-binding domain-containing protein [Bacteroidota bacterium]MDP4249215.1 NAD(P)-binding domain-containing protein [Bacteroidota bacterium]